MKDRTTGTTIRANTDSFGSQADDASGAPSIFADGRYVVFRNHVAHLNPHGRPSAVDIYRSTIPPAPPSARE